MVDKKISQMTELTTISDSDMIEVVHTLSNFKLLFSTIKGWIQTWITKAMVGLGNVDNTSDLTKPISNATQLALNLKADTSALNSYLTISNASDTYVTLSQKGAANGVVPLGSDGKIASAYLPSYVDDVLEYNGTGNFPQPGESGKLYIDTSVTSNNTYRWSGSQYVHIAASPGSTDAVPEGATNLYFTNARAVAALQSTLSSYAPQAWVNNNYMPRAGGTFTGPISMTAGSVIQAAGGDWGAYIYLTKAPNGSLTSPTVLQFQDKLLFFESGGSGRGAYLDWGNLSSWGNNKILTTSDLNNYATQNYVQNYVNQQSFATQAYVQNALNSVNIGFTPVQQGGGSGQGNNKVYLGWASAGNGLKVQVDSSDLGYLVFQTQLSGYATQGWVQSYVNGLSLATQSFVTSQGYATTSYVDQQIANSGGLSGAEINSTTKVINQNTVGEFPLPSSQSKIYFFILRKVNTSPYWALGLVFNYSATGRFVALITNNGFATSTGSLGGSTGASGAMTLTVANGTRNLYLENRAETNSFQCTFLG